MRRSLILIAVLVVVVVGGTTLASADVTADVVNACVNDTTFVVRIRPTSGCVSGETPVTWSVPGPDSASQILSKLLTVDGNGSGLDASFLDGVDSTGFLTTTGKAADADKLDGINSTGFAQRRTSGSGTIGLTAIAANSCVDVQFGIGGLVPGDTVVLNVTSGDSLPARLTMSELDVPSAGKLNVRICNGTNTASVADSSIGVRWYALR
jgi:hypothetical protein